MEPASGAFDRLLSIIDKLRSPDGCLWDRSQTKEDIALYLRDETYEVLEAIQSGSSAHIKEELGDVLFQIIFIARIAEDNGDFTVSDVLTEISSKMIRRHPHVFSDQTVKDVDEIKENWEAIKKKEKNRKKDDSSVLCNIPASLPPILRAMEITKKASKAGFDWDTVDGVLEKIEEELHETRQALKSKVVQDIENEIGDLLFSLVNLCRFTQIDPEMALSCSINKFIKRFKFIEDTLREKGTEPKAVTIAEMDALWNMSKHKGPAET